jgi:hypothetical protein
MRFSGSLGYGETVENPVGSGIWEDQIVEVPCKGDVQRDSKRAGGDDVVNSDIVLVMSFSIIADDRALRDYTTIKYVEWEGARWTPSSIEVRRPRLLIYAGGVYNGPTP